MQVVLFLSRKDRKQGGKKENTSVSKYNILINIGPIIFFYQKILLKSCEWILRQQLLMSSWRTFFLFMKGVFQHFSTVCIYVHFRIPRVICHQIYVRLILLSSFYFFDILCKFYSSLRTPRFLGKVDQVWQKIRF